MEHIARQVLAKLEIRPDDRSIHNTIIAIRQAERIGAVWCENPKISVDHLQNEVVLEHAYQQLQMANGNRYEKHKVERLVNRFRGLRP